MTEAWNARAVRLLSLIEDADGTAALVTASNAELAPPRRAWTALSSDAPEGPPSEELAGNGEALRRLFDLRDGHAECDLFHIGTPATWGRV